MLSLGKTGLRFSFFFRPSLSSGGLVSLLPFFFVLSVPSLWLSHLSRRSFSEHQIHEYKTNNPENRRGRVQSQRSKGGRVMDEKGLHFWKKTDRSVRQMRCVAILLDRFPYGYRKIGALLGLTASRIRRLEQEMRAYDWQQRRCSRHTDAMDVVLWNLQGIAIGEFVKSNKDSSMNLKRVFDDFSPQRPTEESPRSADPAQSPAAPLGDSGLAT